MTARPEPARPGPARRGPDHGGASPTLLGDDLEDLHGQVVDVVYRDPSSGFGVALLDAEQHPDEPARASGPLSDLVAGQRVRLVGRWTDHDRWGPTFDATLYEQLVPRSADAVRSFLASERFAEVDAAVREAVVDALGDEAGEALEAGADRLVAAGVDRDDAELLAGAWAAGRALSALDRLLAPAGVGPADVRAVHARFGAAAVEVVTDEPYRLVGVGRLGFPTVDRIARRAGGDPADPARLAAAALAAVAAARGREGHQVVERPRVVADAARLLGSDALAAAAGVDRAVADGTLVEVTVAGRGPDGRRSDEVVALGPGPAVRAERGLAAELARLLRAEGRLAAREVPPVSAELTAGQVAAVHGALASTLAVLTGGPGTGKTRTIEEVVAAAESLDAQVALCAPTGRAAKRIEELVGRPATTVHRLLEARPTEDDGFVFRYGPDERLPFDLVVCDEVSMCDTSLARSLVSAVDDGAHLLLVGDPHQLPSVGPGDVLADLVASPHVPVHELTEVHRQAAESRIVGLARDVDAGVVGDLPPVDHDVFMAEEPRRDRIVARVVAAVADNAPRHLGVEVEDVQVVAPVYRGPVGVDALNAALRERLNPDDGGASLAGLRRGDRVMQTRNDPDLDVANGDVGTVVDVGRGRLRVAFPRGEVRYDAGAARDLVLAWAVTVHKSQGGEWPVVVLVADRSHGSMLGRNLVYTAITRAARALVVVGQAEAVRRAADRDGVVHRLTGLVEALDRAVAVTDG